MHSASAIPYHHSAAGPYLAVPPTGAPPSAIPGAALSASAAAASLVSPPPTMHQPPMTNVLYLGDLAPQVTEQVLFSIFHHFGPIVFIQVARDPTGRSLGYAYIQFYNPAHAQHALESLNYTSIYGRPCRIMWYQPDATLRKTGFGNIFVGHLHVNIDSRALFHLFRPFGNVLSCKVVVDDRGKSRGYGYVHFDSSQAAEQSIAQMNGATIMGRKIFVCPYQPKGERAPKAPEEQRNFTNLFVANLTPDINETDIFELFSPYGEITSHILLRDSNGKPKGCGFVNFRHHENAVKAMTELNNTTFKNCTITVEKARSKNDRNNSNQNNNQNNNNNVNGVNNNNRGASRRQQQQQQQKTPKGEGFISNVEKEAANVNNDNSNSNNNDDNNVNDNSVNDSNNNKNTSSNNDNSNQTKN